MIIMSFLFETISIPAWFIIFIVASAAPLWFSWYKIFHKKFIATGLLKKKLGIAKSDAEMKLDIMKKATEHWTSTSEMESFAQSHSQAKTRKKTKRELDPVKRQNIQVVLKSLAEQGEKGALPKTISDNSNVNYIDTASALAYLVEKKYAEVISGTVGAKYYLTRLGRKYCMSKKIIPRDE
jgi:predicted transcriptional regulator